MNHNTKKINTLVARFTNVITATLTGRPDMVYSLGNRKIAKNTLILNMGSATDCPSAAAGLCTMGKKCYALKAERCYPDALPSRRRAATYWLTTDADTIAADIIRVIRSVRHRVNEVRLNESGDFYGQDCVTKLSRIADILALFGVHVYTYTHRKDLNYAGLSDNLTLNGTRFMIHNEFIPVPAPTWTRPVCPGSCDTCTLCKVSAGNSIEIIIH